MLHSVAKKVLFSDFNYYEVRAHIDYSPKLVNSQGLIPCYAANQWAPRGGTWDFKWRGWSNVAKSQDPKKSPGLPSKPPKNPGPKINPQKSRADFVALTSSRKV